MFYGVEEVNQLIGKIRIEKQISQSALGEGICSGQQISKIESGKASPNFFLAEILMQRLGRTLDKFEIVLSLDEYEEIEARDDLIDELRQGRLAEAEERLKRLCGGAAADYPIRRMIQLKFWGILELEKGQYRNAEKYLEEAVQTTLGCTGQIILEGRLLAESELETLILYAQALWFVGKAIQARDLLEKLSGYVQTNIDDQEVLARFQAKIAVVLGGICNEAGEYSACAKSCGEALELLRDNDLAQCMPSLLALLVEAYKQTGRQEESLRMSCWRKTLEQVYRHFGLDVSIIDKLYFNACISQYYLIGEIIREERRAHGWSQEDLIAGIYQESATLSRVENGQLPDKRKMRQLLSRLGLSRRRYEGEVITADYHMLELNREAVKLCCRHETEKVEWIMERMRKRLDMSIPENRQFVGREELVKRFRKGEFTPEETYRKADELLQMTYREGTERVPFSNEVRLINTKCMCLQYMGRINEAVSVYKKILERFKKSRVRLKYHFRTVGLIMNNMTLYLAHSDDIEEVEIWSGERIQQQLLNGKVNTIHYALSNFVGLEEYRAEKKAGVDVDFTSHEADVMYGGVRKKCLQYVDWAYYITDIFKQYVMQDLFVKFEKENLGADIKRI